MAHIVYIITKLELGGAQKVCLSLMEHLAKSPDGASLISGPEGILVPDAKKFSSVFLIPSLKREISTVGIWSDFRAFFTMISTLRSLKKKHKNIIVHTHSTKAGIMGRWAALCAGIKQRIHTVHGYGFHNQQSWALWLALYIVEYITFFITTHAVCVSHADRATGIRLFHNFKRKSSVINAAVQSPSFIPAVRTPNKMFTIGTVACFKPQKNLIDLLEAFNWIVHNTKQPIHLMIIGDGIQRPIIETFIAHNNLTKHVTLLGWQNNVYTWMQQWDIFALSSLWEGLPCAVVEARLCKLPVVAYNVGGISEVIYDGKNGHLITPGDWKSLATHLNNLVTTPAYHYTLSTYADTLTAFDIPCMVEQHCKLYKHVTTRYKKEQEYEEMS